MSQSFINPMVGLIPTNNNGVYIKVLWKSGKMEYI